MEANQVNSARNQGLTAPELNTVVFLDAGVTDYQSLQAGVIPEREQWKWKLIRGLYEKEFEREQIIKLFEIIDNLMTLSPELQSSLESKIKQFDLQIAQIADAAFMRVM